MATREQQEQAEQERLRQQQQQQEERMAAPRGMQADGEDETVSNPIIINK